MYVVVAKWDVRLTRLRLYAFRVQNLHYRHQRHRDNPLLISVLCDVTLMTAEEYNIKRADWSPK
jgi:hypothetical protein